MFTRIMVPLDGSARAETAIPVAARLARASGGSILLAQVAAIPRIYEFYGGSSYLGAVIDIEIQEAEAYLKTMARSEELAGIIVDTTALFGAAAQTLLSMAAQFEADLVVMTSQGNTGMKRWVLGSVAHKLARHSPIPVLVLHEAGTMPVGARPDGRPVRALVTLDGSVLAKSALEPAAQLIAALSAPAPGALHLLRVVKPPAFNEKEDIIEYITRMREQALHKAKTYMQSIVGHLRESPIGEFKLAITWSVALSDDVAETIIQTAESGEDAAGAGVPGRCDVIVMATHGRAGFQHWVLGSVTERVLSATRLPLLIVRPEETAFQKASEEKASSGMLIADLVSPF
jgi:nucleotide-binding universal stress UspA family protein